MNALFCIYGSGGFASESLMCLKDQYGFTRSDLREKVVFMVDDIFCDEKEIMGVKILPRSLFEVEKYAVIVAIGDPNVRKQIIKSLPPNTVYTTVIHPSVIMSEWVKIGAGTIITAGSILTCNIKIGKHTHINLNTTVGHDCTIGDYVTTAPGVNISGRCRIDDNVYLGTGCSIRENISICSNVIVGMGACVVKNIYHAGTYVGTPAKFLK